MSSLPLMQKNINDMRVFVAAKERIIKHGWIQTYFGNEREGFCLLGAIDAVTFNVNDFNCARIKILNKLDGPSITRWNDDPSRTKEQVIELLDSLIKDEISA